MCQALCPSCSNSVKEGGDEALCGATLLRSHTLKALTEMNVEASLRCTDLVSTKHLTKTLGVSPAQFCRVECGRVSRHRGLCSHVDGAGSSVLDCSSLHPKPFGGSYKKKSPFQRVQAVVSCSPSMEDNPRATLSKQEEKHYPC